MPYKTNDELPEDVKSDLSPAQQEAFRKAFNAAVEQGKDEEDAFKIAWAAARQVRAAEARLLKHYKILSPGTYSPSPEEITITASDVQDFVDAVNRKADLGVPVSIKYDHRDGLSAIAVGRILGAVLEGDTAYADLEFSMDAEYDGIRVASVAQMCDGLERGILQGSMEAFRKYKSKAYTGEREFALWPTAWAVLPAGEQPAVPPRLVAGETGVESVRVTGAPITGAETPRKEIDMTLEEALKEIERLKGELAEAKKAKATDEKLDEKDREIEDLKAKVDEFIAADKAAMDAKAKALTASVLDKLVPGKRDGIKAKLGEMDSHQKVQFLEVLDDSLEPLKAGDVTTDTGDSDEDAGTTREQRIGAQKQAIIKAADEHKLNLMTLQGDEEATRIAMRDHPELFAERE